VQAPASAVASMPPLRINEPAPDFQARTTVGDISLQDYRGRWLLLFSHPADFTPVCTSEFIAFAKAQSRFDDLNCGLLALSVDGLYSHLAWLRDIRDRFGVTI
jgi:peroxiredoxin (alkyl hydroperoxide reductase subunit C)